MNYYSVKPIYAKRPLCDSFRRALQYRLGVSAHREGVEIKGSADLDRYAIAKATA